MGKGCGWGKGPGWLHEERLHSHPAFQTSYVLVQWLPRLGQCSHCIVGREKQERRKVKAGVGRRGKRREDRKMRVLLCMLDDCMYTT